MQPQKYFKEKNKTKLKKKKKTNKTGDDPGLCLKDDSNIKLLNV